MRKVAIAFLLSSPAKRAPASFHFFRSLATRERKYAFANTEDALAEASMAASETRKATEKKKASRLKKCKSACSLHDLRGAELSLPAQISTVTATTRAKAKIAADKYVQDLAACIVATKKATELTEVPVVKAENVTVYETAAVGKREELAACAKATANRISAHEELTEIIAKLNVKAYMYGSRWEKTAHKLLDYEIPLAHIIIMLQKCRTLPCSLCRVDSTLKHFVLLGMSHQEMGRVISKLPTILNVTDSMFQCKIEMFQSFGIDRNTVRKILAASVKVIMMPLAVLRQNIAFWTDYMKDVRTNAVSIMMLRNPKLLIHSLRQEKLAWLEAQHYDKKWLLGHSYILAMSLPVLISKYELLEHFGISNARKRAWVLSCVYGYKISTLQARFDNLITAGFSFDQVQTIISKTPVVLGRKVDDVNLRIDYVVNVMNASLDAIVLSPSLWSHTWEARIKYRYETVKRLQTLGALMHSVTLEYMINMSNVDFNRRFVERFQNAVKQPDAFRA